MIPHSTLADRELHQLLRTNQILFAGNKKLKIYGVLPCKSGKRLKKENRVFFASEKEAINLGYRPCGSCLKIKYKRYFAGHLT
jgi:methylphosphotriester-DNA--protein-cysteine methyltransferase